MNHVTSDSEQADWIDLKTAMRLTGRGTRDALISWIKRFNFKHPESVVRRRWGSICRSDLENAIELEAAAYTPNYSGAEAISALATKAASR